MGMYTELHFNTELREDVPKNVVEVLEYMMHLRKMKRFEIPDHPLFKTDRWERMFIQDSYCFKADTHSTLRFDDIANAYILCIRCNLKNYDNEIEWFVNWVMPYLGEDDGDFLGFHRYEETEEPTLIYMKGDK